jgi:type II secretion system protein J
MIDRHKKSEGFTVVELIVAMSISAITLLSGYELLQALKDVGDRQSDALATTASIVRGLDRIREDLLHALPRTGSQGPVFTGANPRPEGNTETTEILGFCALCVGDSAGHPRGLRQLCRVRYELVTIEETVYLYRNAAPVVGADRTSGANGRERILDHIDNITLTFHNGQTSESSFSSNDRLPVGVELTVTVHRQAWPLSVRLPCGIPEGQL